MPTLEVITGKNAGQKFDVPSSESEVTLGNRRTATVVLKDPWISFMHAVITKKDGAYLLADKRSRAGTTVNGQKVDERGRPLKDGDTFSLGKTEIRFRDADAGKAAQNGGAAAAAPASPFGAPAAPAPSGPFSPFAPAAASSPFTPVAAAAGTAAAPSGALAEDLKRAQTDLQSLRTALAARDKSLAEAQAKLRALEAAAKGGAAAGPKPAELQKALDAAQAESAAAMERAVKAETDLVQLKQQHEETVAKAKIRLEEVGRLNQTLEARLRQGGAGAAVDQERELSQTREELRRVREAGRARLDQLTQENAALKARLEEAEPLPAGGAVTAGGGGDAGRVAELEAQVAEAERSRAVMEQRADELSAKLDAKETELEALRAERAPPPPVSQQENEALERALAETNRELEEARAEAAGLREQLAQAAEAGAGAAARDVAAAEPSPAAAPAPAPAGGGADAGTLSQLEAACESLRRERDEAREEAQTLRKDLEDINEDMLAQEEEYQQRIAELEAKLSGES